MIKIVRNNIKIVVVDDNHDFVDILGEYLSIQDGVDLVGTADNGLEAVDLITSIEPDIVVLDIVMPYLDGLGVLDRVNSKSMNKRPQFIILSSMEYYKIIQLAFSLGAEYFMMKPFDLQDLVTRIRQLHALEDKGEIRISVTDNKQAKNMVIDISIEAQIKSLLDKLGLPSKLKGYNYLVYAVNMVIQDLSVINSISKTIYSRIAQEYKTTFSRVERSIRNAIEIVWTRGDLDYLAEQFGCKMDCDQNRPSNSEFIMMIANNFMMKS